MFNNKKEPAVELILLFAGCKAINLPDVKISHPQMLIQIKYTHDLLHSTYVLQYPEILNLTYTRPVILQFDHNNPFVKLNFLLCQAFD
jgi:hypothetical protein